jgi:hypothetical protein
MSRNGAGTYTLPNAAFVPNTVISVTPVNGNFSDIATALTDSLAKDGQTTPTANLPMGGFKHTGVANGSARTDYAALGQVQDAAFQWGGTAGGTADAITLTPTPAISAYAAGQVFRFVSSGANTGAVTLAVSGLATKDVQSPAGSALSAGNIVASGMYEAAYDGTAFRLSVGSATEASPGTAELATQSETNTGTDDARIVTPLKLTARFTATINMQDATLQRPVIRDYGETVNVITASSATTYDIDVTAGNVVSLVQSANITLTISNPSASGTSCSLTILRAKDNNTTTRSITWPASVKWGGGAPTLSGSANAVDIVTLVTIDGGTTWYASAKLNAGA